MSKCLPAFKHLVEMIMFRVSSEKGRKSFGTC